jgi:hypothetical protein
MVFVTSNDCMFISSLITFVYSSLRRYSHLAVISWVAKRSSLDVHQGEHVVSAELNRIVHDALARLVVSHGDEVTSLLPQNEVSHETFSCHLYHASHQLSVHIVTITPDHL